MDHADSAKTGSKIQDLEKRAKEAMHLPEDHRVRFTDLHDALTSMRFHGKQIPKVQPSHYLLGSIALPLYLMLHHFKHADMCRLVLPKHTKLLLSMLRCVLLFLSTNVVVCFRC